MRAFFELLDSASAPRLRDAVWNQRLGADLVESLRDLGLLEPDGASTTFPCQEGRACHRDVELHPLAGSRPFTHLARCTDFDRDPEGDEEPCPHLELTAEQVQASLFRRDAFQAMVQRLLGLPLAPAPARRELPGTFSLGHKVWAGGERAWFLSWDAGTLDFERFLLLHQVNEGPALVLVPLGEALEPEVRDRHTPSDTVAVVGLDRLLVFEAGRFALSPWARSQLSALSVNRPGPADRYCSVLESGGPPREIGHDEYLALSGRASQYDLVLDLMSRPRRGVCAAGRRTLQGEYESVCVPAAEANVVAQVMLAPGGLMPREFLRPSERTPKTFFAGRKKLDLRLGGPDGPWRAFTVRTGGLASETRYAFTPPEGFRFLLLHDLQAALRKKAATAAR